MSPYGDVALAKSLNYTAYMAMAHFFASAQLSWGAQANSSTHTRTQLPPRSSSHLWAKAAQV